jgi:thymidine phosphorylase
LAAGDPVCLVHARNEADADAAIAALAVAVRIGEDAPAPQHVIMARITDSTP